MSSILVTRPEDDRLTKYISQWAKDFIDTATKKGHKVLDLWREKANQKQLEGMLKKQQPSFIFFNGHGDDQTITGHLQETLIQAGVNEGWLKGAIVYALACNCAKVLGPASVKRGALAFVGYERTFALFWSDKDRTRPLQDELGKHCLSPSYLFITHLLKGQNVQQAYDYAKKAYADIYLKLSSSEASDEESSVLPFAYRNYRAFVYLGDGKATINPL